MTCSWDGSLQVWDVERGKQIGADWRDDRTGMITIALSPDGKRVLSGSTDGAVRLWDIDTAKIFAKWTGHTAGIISLLNGDGRRVVSRSYNKTVWVWDAGAGETIIEPLELTYVEAVVYSPDERMIAGATIKFGFNQIFDANTGKLVTFTNPAWPGDGKTLISGSEDGRARIWTTWQQIGVLTGDTDGCILASTHLGNTARLWNLDNGQPIRSPLQLQM
jgi:WD40 repeat protein